MYSIYCDSELMYEDVSNDINRKIIDGTLSLEANSAGSLDLTVPFTNKCFHKLEVMKSHISVFRDDTKIWGGRPFSESQDFDDNRKLTCEGELAYLNDTYQPIHEYHNMTISEFVGAILNVHNMKCDHGAALDGDLPEDLWSSETTEERESRGTFDKNTYLELDAANANWRFIKIRKGMRVSNLPWNSFISGGQGKFHATATNVITIDSSAVDTTTLDFSTVRLMFEAKPYVLLSNGDGSYRKQTGYEYCLYYGTSDRNYFNNTKFTSTENFSKVFDDVKLTETQYNNGVALLVSLVIRRIDGQEMTDDDITRLSTANETGPSSRCSFQWKQDTVHRQGKTYSKTKKVMGSHRSKKIYPGIITVYDNSECEYRYTYYETTMDTLRKLVDNLGGVIRVRTGDDGKLYLDYLREYINVNSQTIEFGKNLLDYVRNRDMSNLCTALLPLGAKKDSETLVGDEIKLKNKWLYGCALTEDGTKVDGTWSCATIQFQVESKTTIYSYDTQTDQHKREEKDNRLYYIGEQLNDRYMWMFYDRDKRPLSGYKADSHDGRTEKHTSWWGNSTDNSGVSYISIPSEAKWVGFAFYLGGQSFDPYNPQVAQSDGLECKVKYVCDDSVTWEFSSNTHTLDKCYFLNTVLLDYVSTKDVLNDFGTTYPAEYYSIPFNRNVYGESVDSNKMITKPIKVKGGEKYYLTSRLNEGFAFYCIYGDNGYKLTTDSIKTAANEVAYSDMEKEEIKIPSGAAYMIVGGMRNVGVDAKLYGEYKNKSGYYDPPDEYVTIESVNDGSLYLVDEDLAKEYGWIEKQVEFDSAENPEDLLDLAKKYMANMNYNDITLEISAFDFNLADAYTEPFDLLDLVYCHSSIHRLSRYFPITKLEIPLTKPEEQTITLGEEPRDLSISESSAASDSQVFEKLDKIPTPSSVIKAAVDNATNIINSGINSNVFVGDEEILIMDSKDVNLAKNLWRMNAAGIGHSSNGYYGPYSLAFTMDGSIVADRITTGFMSADRIRGGTLTLGGYDNISGEFYMQNERGKNFIEMTKDGAKMNATISQPFGFRHHDESNVTDPALSFGMLNIDKGVIYGSFVELDIKDNKDFANQTDWWKNYVFSFDDVKTQTNLTALNMYAGWGVDIWGVDLYSADYFMLVADSVNSNNGYGRIKSDLKAPGIWISEGYSRFQFTSAQNKNYIVFDMESNSGDDEFQSLVHDFSVNMEKINIFFDTLNIYKQNGVTSTLLTGFSGTYTLGNNGSITITNGFVTALTPPGGNSGDFGSG